MSILRINIVFFGPNMAASASFNILNTKWLICPERVHFSGLYWDDIRSAGNVN